jgi:nucleoside-diphosphate-sugar epimerase
MKILITGGCGFKGAVLSQLLRFNHDVTALDSHLWGVRHVPSLIERDIKVVTGDIRDQSVMAPLLKEADAVINLAAVVGYPACEIEPRLAEEVNVKAVCSMLEMMSKDQMFIQASTGSVYGKLENMCAEDSPLNPLTVYGRTKLEAEKPVIDFGGVCPRFATAFGVSPCMRFDLLPNFFCYRAVHDRYIVMYEANARRTLIDVHDMARSYEFILKNYKEMSGDIYNIGDESLNLSKKSIAEKVCSITKAQLFIESIGSDRDGRDYEVNYTKIKSLGFTCTHSLESQLPQIIECAKIVERSGEWRTT